DLAALDIRRDQVDDLDPGLEDLDVRREVAEARGIAVNGPALDIRRCRFPLVDRVADDVPQAPEGRLPDRNGDRPPGILDLEPAGQAARGVHRHGANTVVAEVLLYLGDQLAAVR